MDMQPLDSEFPSDLSPLAWVQEELRRSLESVHKALRRQLRDADSRASNFSGEGQSSASLQAAAVQLHQVAGVLSLVGQSAGSAILKAAERAVEALAKRPTSVDAHAVEIIERADFALLSFVARLLAGNKSSPLALFPAYRDLQTFNGAERIHPADLWLRDWQWRELPADPSAQAQAASSVRAPFEQALLKHMRTPTPASAGALSDLCAALAAGLQEPHSRTLWQLAAAVFEAESGQLLKSDAYLKRNGSRLLSQLRAVRHGDAGLSGAGERLAQDLLFFCAQAVPRSGQASRLSAVRAAYALDEEQRGDYEDASLGRIDPNWVAQAKRRVGVAKDSWSSAAEGDTQRLAGLDEQFAALGESLARLFPSGEVLGETLQRAVVATLRSGKPPSPALAMEAATSILYVEAALEDAAFDQPEQAERVRRMATRVEAVAHGQEPEPLETWMEELYRRVSDRQTLGSVVHELRASLSEIEKHCDAYFRDTTQRELLIPVPGQLQTMRGVLSVLGLTQAATACLRMRDEIDRLANTEVDPEREGPRELFERLATNLGAMGFLIDMLSVQPALAKRMFRFDEASGRLEPVMGRHQDVAPVVNVPSVTTVPAPLPLAATPAAKPVVSAPVMSTRSAADPEMQGIFLEEAQEVLTSARNALAQLTHDSSNQEHLTTLRRAFHTLKGSARMVGFDAFGEGGWACEQIFNARLGEASPKADKLLIQFCADALGYFSAWTAQIESGAGDGEFSPEPLRASADALRLHGQYLPLLARHAEPVVAEPVVPELLEVVPEAPAIEAIQMPSEAPVEEPIEVAAPAPADSGFDMLELPMDGADFELPEVEKIPHFLPTEAAHFAHTELTPITARPAVTEPPSFELKLDLDSEDVLPEPVLEELSLDAPTIASELTDAELEAFGIVVPSGNESEIHLEPEPVVTPPALHVVATEVLPEPEEEARDSEEDNVKVIGPLRVSITLFNIFLNEADEISRRLSTLLAEWSIELVAPVPPAAEAQAHALAGNAGTVGFEDLSTLARALEHALGHAAHATRYSHDDAQVFVRAADDIRHLLHQFAAGFLKTYDAEVLAALHAYAPDIVEETDSVMGEPDLVPDLAPQALVALAIPSADADEPEPGLPDQIEPELFGFFEEEAADLLEQLHGALREWQNQPAGKGGEACMRVLHTFKGGARLSGAMRLGEQAHQLESAVEHVLRSDTRDATQILILQDLADALESNYRALCERVHAPVAPIAPVVPVAPVAVAAPEPLAVEPLAEPAAEAIAELPAAPIEAPASTPALAVSASATIDWSRFADPAQEMDAQDAALAGTQALLRVRASLLERMAAQAGEVSVRRSRLDSELAQMKSSLLDLDENLERLRGQLRELELQAEAQMGTHTAQAQQTGRDFDPLEFDRYTRFQELTKMLAESVGDVATVQRSLARNVQTGEDELAAQSRLTRELQDDLLRTRMVEFESMGERMHRVVRQAARDSGKQAKLEIVGGQTELDRSVLERMAGAFEHLLRNSVSHGLEAPDKRTAAGKDATGTLRVALHQEGNEIQLDFSDDGAGLNLARIRERGLQLGLIKRDDAPDEQTLMQLIFAPGFSTASQVTELSGRGVGMDVVRAEVSTLGGSIETFSEPGKGARFALRLPLTTALTQVVLLRVGEQSVAVPAALMDSVQRIPTERIETAYVDGQIEVGGHMQPFFWLGGLLGQEGRGHGHGKTQSLVLVRSAQRRMALHVDEVQGNQEVVVKNLGPQLHRVPGLAGISLLASGDVALIYNPVALADWYGVAAKQRLLPDAVPAAVVEEVYEAEAPLVLVVDDSLTVRRATQRLLERDGFRVLLAKDGLDAMERLAGDELPAMVLSDIEMPRMDGFDLVRNMRGDARLKDLPVIMITSRIAQKHRDYAAELGVDHYLGKPYDEEQLLDLVRRYTRRHFAASVSA